MNESRLQIVSIVFALLVVIGVFELVRRRSSARASTRSCGWPPRSFCWCSPFGAPAGGTVPRRRYRHSVKRTVPNCVCVRPAAASPLFRLGLATLRSDTCARAAPSITEERLRGLESLKTKPRLTPRARSLSTAAEPQSYDAVMTQIRTDPVRPRPLRWRTRSGPPSRGVDRLLGTPGEFAVHICRAVRRWRNNSPRRYSRVGGLLPDEYAGVRPPTGLDIELCLPSITGGVTLMSPPKALQRFASTGTPATWWMSAVGAETSALCSWPAVGR